MRQQVLTLSLLLLAQLVFALPARNRAIQRTQPDGTQVTLYQQGDEYMRWLTNEQGEWMQQDNQGFYRIMDAATITNKLNHQSTLPQRIAPANRVAVPLNIAPRGLVILVNFTDVTFQTEKAAIDSMLMGKNYTRNYTYISNGQKKVQSSGSAQQYFTDASNGAYTPIFDIVGPVTVSHDMAYYGAQDPNTNFDKRPWDMVAEACKLADSEWNVDFTQYDNDNDGVVDFVYVIYAGFGEADGAGENTIWPHAYHLSDIGTYCKIDDKRIDLYACGNEVDYFTKQHTGIGPFCHEFSHVLGLPDLYTTKGQTHKTHGSWSIMDHGPYNNECNTPPTYSAYERFFMGWITPRVITAPENVTLAELSQSNSALLISTSGTHNLIGNNPNPLKFYLLENRQQQGWDSYLPGHGLMLTYVQYSYKNWTENKVNNTASRMGVNLIEADGSAPSVGQGDGYIGKASDLFPEGATEYLQIADHPIEEIIEQNGTIYFKYKGGTTSAVHELKTQGDIVAIYNILGQKQSTTALHNLPQGTYIVVTTTGTYKIIH